MRAEQTARSYPGLGTGDPDLYQAFAWRFWQLLRDGGILAFVVPRSLLNGASGTEYDNSDMPNVVSVAVYDDDENEPEPTVYIKPTKIEEPLVIRKTAMPASRPVPAKSRSDVSIKSATVSKIGTSGIQVGTRLKHKTFGKGGSPFSGHSAHLCGIQWC